MQGANWETVRDQRNQFVDTLTATSVGHPQVVGNGLIVDYPDGSQVTWVPSITRDAR